MNATGERHETALQKEVENGQEECVELLIKAKACVITRNYQGFSPLALAAQSK